MSNGMCNLWYSDLNKKRTKFRKRSLSFSTATVSVTALIAVLSFSGQASFVSCGAHRRSQHISLIPHSIIRNNKRRIINTAEIVSNSMSPPTTTTTTPSHRHNSFEAGNPMIIDGKTTAQEIQKELKEEVDRLQNDHGVLPGLAVILVGQRVDSATYVRMKKKTAAAIGLHSIDVDLPEAVTQLQLLEEVDRLNKDPAVHGILVQLPLPSHIDEAAILKAIAVEKDADGFSALNIGNLCLRGGDPPLAVPCTPAGCIELLQRYDVEISGKDCVVLGRSNIVGMPVAALLQSCNGTVTVCHSRTSNIEEKVRQADIIIAAIGKTEFVKGSWIKPGAVIIDVGINDKPDSTRKRGYRLVGDVDYEECSRVASAITPVPGGVGPMTIVMLMKNTINLARHSIGLSRMPLRNAIHRNLSHRDFVSLNQPHTKEG